MLGDFPQEYRSPKVRLPGSGGASDMAASCERTILIMPHERRRFREKISYVTSPGHIDGSPGAREKAGLLGQGPYRVITAKAIMDFDEQTRRMRLRQLLPGESVESVQEATGFELLIHPELEDFPPPTEEELHLIREEIDPMGMFVKKPAGKKLVSQF
jgi:glutaconate CoA-transferase subunit B